MGHEGSIVSDFIAILLILVFVVKFIEGAKSGKKIDLDNIELFKIQETQIVEVPTVTQKTVKQKSRSKNKTKSEQLPLQESLVPIISEPRNKYGYTPLQQDCFDALKSLGIKTIKERKFIVQNTFNKHNPSTIQDFLKVALHRNASS